MYIEASSQANRITGCTSFIKETDNEIRGRIPNYTPTTLDELHAVNAVIIWIWRQHFNEKDIIYSVGALTIISTAGFQTYPEMITEIYITE